MYQFEEDHFESSVVVPSPAQMEVHNMFAQNDEDVVDRERAEEEARAEATEKPLPEEGDRTHNHEHHSWWRHFSHV